MNKYLKNIPWELKAIVFREASGKWFSCNHTRLIFQDEQSISLQLSNSETNTKINLIFEFQSTKMDLRINADQETTVEWIGIDLNATPQDHFIGLGERFDSLDQAGKRVDLMVVNASSGGRTYKPIPFYMSDAGYGVHVNTHAQIIIDFATALKPNETNIRIADHKAEFTFSFHPTFKQNLMVYAASAGRPDLPPPWIFGPWKSRDWTLENQETAFEDIELIRTHHLAGTVKVIDAAWEAQLNDFMFDPEKFPDAQAFIDRCHALGFKLVIWIAPWMVYSDPPTPVFKFCAEKGFLITKSSGETYIHNLGNSPTFMGSCFDFSNPDAVEWWQQQIKRLVIMGVDGFKTDFGEQVPLDARFSDGRSGVYYHNLFPVIYNHATYQAMTEIKPGTLLARSAWHGSQAYGVIWAGDQTSDFSPANGLPSVIIAGQAAGVSGFPFWTSDIGGYFGTPTEKVFIRWIQFGAFCPIMQIHGLGNREPWNYSDQTFQIYRRFAQLHLDLFPYIYAAAKNASRTGIPIMRALALEYQEDPKIWSTRAQHQYMFGDQIMVAPIYSSDDKYSIVYLPNGTWCDFWNGKKYTGGTEVNVPGSLETIPVFVKAGAIIPMLDPSPDTLLETQYPDFITAGSDLRLQIFPGEDGLCILADGTRFVWMQNEEKLQIINGPFERQISIKVLSPEFESLGCHDDQNRSLSIQSGSLGGDPDFYRVSVRKNQLINFVINSI